MYKLYNYDIKIHNCDRVQVAESVKTTALMKKSWTRTVWNGFPVENMQLLYHRKQHYNLILRATHVHDPRTRTLHLDGLVQLVGLFLLSPKM